MNPEYLRNQIKNKINSPDILPEQREVLLKYDLDSEKNEGLSLWSRLNQISRLCSLAKSVKKPFIEMTKEDIERFIYCLNLSFSSLDLTKVYVRKFFRWLCKSDNYPDVVNWIKFANHNKRKLPEDILCQKEIRAMVEAADHPRDRALISVLYESGCRLGEIIGLKQKDATLDQYGAVIIVNGKTGMRRIRLINSAPDLAVWLNSHPSKGANKPLFVSRKRPDNPLGEVAVQTLVRRLSKKAKLEKRVYPHLMRHSRFTHLAKDFTEAELRMMAGWRQGSRMVDTYIHLSGADVEKKILEKNGLLSKEEKREDEALKARNCPRCKEVNPATAKFCYKCGMALDMETAMKIEKEDAGTMFELIDLVRREPRLLDILKSFSSASSRSGRDSGG